MLTSNAHLVPVITGIPFGTITLINNAKHFGWFSSPQDSFLSGSLFPRNSVVESWMIANPSFGFSLLWMVFHSTLMSLRALIFCCPLSAISTVYILRCPWLQQRQRRAFEVVFHEKRTAPHDSCVRNTGLPCFQTGEVYRFTLLNSIFFCTATAMV